jgi:AcrR family transcriptional regulator
MPKVTQKYLDTQRERIVNAARRCFLRDGFHATSMQTVLADAGVSAGTFYRYFASKDDVILAIAEENLRDVVPLTDAMSAGAAIAEVLEIARTGQDTGIALLVWAEALRNPALARRFSELLARMRDELTELVREHQNNGDLPAGRSAEALAATLISIVPGYVLQLALLGPAAVDGVPDAVRALWPGGDQISARR